MLGDRRRAGVASHMLKIRAERLRWFPSEIFDEHAWTVLLHLFVALCENETVSEERLISSCGSHPSVGRRWIAHLVADGQIVPRHDGNDVTMTPRAIDHMRAFLDAAAEISTATS